MARKNKQLSSRNRELQPAVDYFVIIISDMSFNPLEDYSVKNVYYNFANSKMAPSSCIFCRTVRTKPKKSSDLKLDETEAAFRHALQSRHFPQSPAVFFICSRQTSENVWTQFSGHFPEFKSENS